MNTPLCCFCVLQVLKKAEAALKEAMDSLVAKQEQLQEVEEKVETLKKNLEVVQADQASLQQQAQLTENRLIRAGKLTCALGDEAVGALLPHFVVPQTFEIVVRLQSSDQHLSFADETGAVEGRRKGNRGTKTSSCRRCLSMCCMHFLLWCLLWSIPQGPSRWVDCRVQGTFLRFTS